MQLLEHQAKEWARVAGLTIPPGFVASSQEEVAAAAIKLGDRLVIKAQIPIGRRMQSGGIVITDRERAAEMAGNLLGATIQGHVVKEVLVEQYVAAIREIYLAVAIDQRSAAPMLMLSMSGGILVDQQAASVARVEVPLVTGLHDWHVRQVGSTCGADPQDVSALIEPAKQAFRLFRERRADLVELNPLLLTQDGAAVAADVRIVLSGEQIHAGQMMSRAVDGFDLIEVDPGGAVGLVTTGAGCSMLLMDLLSRAGVRPINFCDLRTGSLHGKRDRLTAVLRALSGYPSLRCVAVNVFAGITDLGEFARLLVASLDECRPSVPVIVRVEGLEVARARAFLSDAGVACAGSLDELIEMVVDATAAEPVGLRTGD